MHVPHDDRNPTPFSPYVHALGMQEARVQHVRRRTGTTPFQPPSPTPTPHILLSTLQQTWAATRRDSASGTAFDTRKIPPALSTAFTPTEGCNAPDDAVALQAPAAAVVAPVGSGGPMVHLLPPGGTENSFFHG